uniref:Guanylate cyclase domain-containing protein n=1 Tax=Plectus sambesii TaxID=2011161 RepID=A0A914XGZ0_9BILA
MVAITMPPLVALAILSAIMGVQFASQIDGTSATANNVKSSSQMTNFISILKHERDATCTYINDLVSNISEKDSAWNDVTSSRAATDSALLSLSVWPTDVGFLAKFPTQQAFLALLNEQRKKYNSSATDCFAVTQFYTENMHLIEAETKDIVYNSDEGQFWRLVDALEMVTYAADLAGIKKSTGRRFFQNGYLDLVTYQSYADVAGGLDRSLDQAITSANYDNTADIAAIEATIEFISDMESDLFANFTNLPVGNDLGRYWDSNMTVFINVSISKLQDFIELQISNGLDSRKATRDWEFGSAMFAVLMAVLLCAPTACLVGYSNYKMNLRIGRKIFELNTEKQKTDLLLHEMLPRSIVNELKAGRGVEPQLYNSATVFFSDILGFTALSAKSQPTQVVTLLNTLYSTMDNVLDRYSCYKVETIGDAYMVVSGVPKLNGREHSSEICTMALDMLREVNEITIPHMPQEHLFMRIGIHTGAVAAGIVGTKMPRYCLFGDTVNTAARMESSGKAMCIHLSQATAEHLQKHHYSKHFICQQLEHMLHIKGKGAMKTYWLLGKHGFPFEIDIDLSHSMVEKGQYWRYDDD